jgi:hypothetical protein
VAAETVATVEDSMGRAGVGATDPVAVVVAGSMAAEVPGWAAAGAMALAMVVMVEGLKDSAAAGAMAQAMVASEVAGPDWEAEEETAPGTAAVAIGWMDWQVAPPQQVPTLLAS